MYSSEIVDLDRRCTEMLPPSAKSSPELERKISLNQKRSPAQAASRGELNIAK